MLSSLEKFYRNSDLITHILCLFRNDGVLIDATNMVYLQPYLDSSKKQCLFPLGKSINCMLLLPSALKA